MALPDWNNVCRRIVGDDESAHRRCVRELDKLDPSDEPRPFLKTEAGQITGVLVLGAIGALWWASKKVKATAATTS